MFWGFFKLHDINMINGVYLVTTITSLRIFFQKAMSVQSIQQRAKMAASAKTKCKHLRVYVQMDIQDQIVRVSVCNYYHACVLKLVHINITYIFSTFHLEYPRNFLQFACISVLNHCVLSQGICKNGATCNFLQEKGYSCTCDAGFTGFNCTGKDNGYLIS